MKSHSRRKLLDHVGSCGPTAWLSESNPQQHDTLMTLQTESHGGLQPWWQQISSDVSCHPDVWASVGIGPSYVYMQNALICCSIKSNNHVLLSRDTSKKELSSAPPSAKQVWAWVKPNITSPLFMFGQHLPSVLHFNPQWSTRSSKLIWWCVLNNTTFGDKKLTLLKGTQQWCVLKSSYDIVW